MPKHDNMARHWRDTRTPQERRNAGWFDGVHARKWNRRPEWSPRSYVDARHPFDRAYGEGFWAGWYKQPYPSPEIYTKRGLPVPTFETE